LSYSLNITGGTVFTNWQQDPFANWNARLVFPEPMRELVIDVELVVEMAVHNPFDFFLEDAAQNVPFAYEAGLRRELTPFCAVSDGGARIAAYIEKWKRVMLAKDGKGEGPRTLDFVVQLNQAIQGDVS
jgi:transglutaminase-like putative cysteine protease